MQNHRGMILPAHGMGAGGEREGNGDDNAGEETGPDYEGL